MGEWMRGFWLLAAGVLIGAALACAAMAVRDALDHGISQTHRCDQLAREDDARRSAGKMLQHLLRDKTPADLTAIAGATGLHVERFDKGGHAEIVIGHGPATAALTFEAPAAGGLSIRALPGQAPCGAAASGGSR